MLHLFVHQYLFLKCITEFLHWNYHWVFLWFCRLYSDGLALGVWFMTSCCCLVEFGFSCFNHASIESWFANYSVLDITGERVIEPIKCMRSPHTSYRWRGERVIEPIKCMRSPHQLQVERRERHRANQVYALTTHQLQVERRRET